MIAADPAYHALGLYESLGFERREPVSGVAGAPTEGHFRGTSATMRAASAAEIFMV